MHWALVAHGLGYTENLGHHEIDYLFLVSLTQHVNAVLRIVDPQKVRYSGGRLTRLNMSQIVDVDCLHVMAIFLLRIHFAYLLLALQVTLEWNVLELLIYHDRYLLIRENRDVLLFLRLLGILD